MAVSTQFLVLCACVWGFYRVEATPDSLSSQDSSFCHGGLEVIYPDLHIDKCLVIPKSQKLREKVSTVWKAPRISFAGAHKRLKEMKKREDKGTGILIGSCMDDTVKLAELGSIAQAALLERRLDISLILIPSRVHSKKRTYVLVMVDPDAPSRTKPTSAYWRHWLVVNVQGEALKKGEIQGTTLTDYHPPTPPQKYGFHRYQFMLFEQLPDVPVSLTEWEKSSRGKWDLQAFVTRFNLGKPVATLQFLTQNYKD